MANSAFSRFKPCVFLVSQTRSVDIVLQSDQKITGVVLSGVGDSSVDISLELWDKGSLIQQSKTIPAAEGTNETGMLQKWRGLVGQGFTSIEQFVSLPKGDKSANVLSICRGASDVAARTVYVEIG